MSSLSLTTTTTTTTTTNSTHQAEDFVNATPSKAPSFSLDPESAPQRFLIKDHSVRSIDSIRTPQPPGWYPPTPLPSSLTSETQTTDSIDQVYLTANATPVASLSSRSYTSFHFEISSDRDQFETDNQDNFSSHISPLSIPGLVRMNDFESAQSSTLQDSRNISDDRHTPDLFFTHQDIAHLQKGEHHYRTIGPALVLKSYRAKEDPLNLPSTPRTVNESSDSVVDTSPIIHPLGSIYSETGIIEIWLNPVESPQRSSRSFNSHPYQLDNHDEHKRKDNNSRENLDAPTAPKIVEDRRKVDTDLQEKFNSIGSGTEKFSLDVRCEAIQSEKNQPVVSDVGYAKDLETAVSHREEDSSDVRLEMNQVQSRPSAVSDVGFGRDAKTTSLDERIFSNSECEAHPEDNSPPITVDIDTRKNLEATIPDAEESCSNLCSKVREVENSPPVVSEISSNKDTENFGTGPKKNALNLQFKVNQEENQQTVSEDDIPLAMLNKIYHSERSLSLNTGTHTNLEPAHESLETLEDQRSGSNKAVASLLDVKDNQICKALDAEDLVGKRLEESNKGSDLLQEAEDEHSMKSSPSLTDEVIILQKTPVLALEASQDELATKQIFRGEEEEEGDTEQEKEGEIKGKDCENEKEGAEDITIFGGEELTIQIMKPDSLRPQSMPNFRSLAHSQYNRVVPQQSLSHIKLTNSTPLNPMDSASLTSVNPVLVNSFDANSQMDTEFVDSLEAKTPVVTKLADSLDLNSPMDTELLHSLDLSSTVDAKLANSLNANCPVDTKLTDSLSISSPLDTEILDSLVTKGTVDAKLADSSDINCLKNTKLVDSLNVNCSVDTKFSDSLDANSPVDAKLVGTSGFKRSMNNNPFFSSDATDLTFEESVPAVTDNLNLRYSSLTSFTSQYGSDDDKKITEQAYTNQEAVVNRVNADILAVEKNLHKENVPAENKVPKSKVNKPFQSPQVHCENLTDPETFQNFDTIPQAPDTDSSAHADSQPKSNTPFPTKNPISVTGVNSNSINDSNANGRAITGGIFQSSNRREVSKADLATEAENAAPNSSNDKQNISFAEMPTSVKKKRSLSALRRKSLLAWGNWNKAEPVPPTPAIPQSVLTSNPVHKQGGESKGFSSQENTEKLDNERVKKQSSSTINTAETKAKTKGQTSSPNWTDSLNKKFLGGKTKLKKENVPTPKSTSTPVSSSGPFTNVVGGIGYSPSNNNSTKKVKEDKASKDRRMGSFFLRLLGKKSTGKTNKTNSFDCLATIT